MASSSSNLPTVPAHQALIFLFSFSGRLHPSSSNNPSGDNAVTLIGRFLPSSDNSRAGNNVIFFMNRLFPSSGNSPLSRFKCRYLSATVVTIGERHHLANQCTGFKALSFFAALRLPICVDIVSILCFSLINIMFDSKGLVSLHITT